MEHGIKHNIEYSNAVAMIDHRPNFEQKKDDQ